MSKLRTPVVVESDYQVRVYCKGVLASISYVRAASALIATERMVARYQGPIFSVVGEG